jgi:hypothetical protein
MNVAWGVCTLFGPCAGGIGPRDRGGSDEMLPVRRQRAVLAKPQIDLQILSVRVVAKFRRIESIAIWRDASSVISRDAFSSAST